MWLLPGSPETPLPRAGPPPHPYPSASPDRKQVTEGEELGAEGCWQGQVIRHLSTLGRTYGQVPLAWGEVGGEWRGRGWGVPWRNGKRGH